MKQYVVVIDGDQFFLFDQWEDVINKLKVRTLEWCLDPNYEGEPWGELFQNCLDNKDFGDIASVFEVEGSFLFDEEIIWYKRM